MTDDELDPTVGVLGAVLSDLSRMPVDVRQSTEAATAIALAKELDRGRLMSTAPVAKELIVLMEKLRGMAGAQVAEEDPLDELARHRATRLSDASGQ